jgi:hypothetical protein
MTKTKITFIKSPTGAFKIAHNVGDSVELESGLARELMEANFAVPAKATGKAIDQKQTATAKPKAKETRSKK